MSAELILKSLPQDIQWLVLFRLSSIRKITKDETVRAMFFLPEDTNLDEYSFVTLSSMGTLLLEESSHQLLNIYDKSFIKADGKSVYDIYEKDINNLSKADPDCVGLGNRPPMPPVIVSMKINDGVAYAETILEREPDYTNYELLKAIGVSYKGGKEKEGRYYAKFENKLPTHVHSGILARFTRTDNCNQFYFNHCNIDGFIEAGLVKAVTARINSGKEKLSNKVTRYANDLPEKVYSLICVPPQPAEEYPYGDIVPYGFVMKALSPEYTDDFTANFGEREKVINYLKDNSVDGLWSYGRRGLQTSTDSALVLMGYYAPKSVDLLEKFSDGNGGYIPQLCSEEKREGYMVESEANKHWCQTDVGTTYLIKALRDTADLPVKTPNSFFEDTFENRGGLFFANPYMTNYFLAKAMKNEPGLEVFRDRLKNEILVSINEDFSFGNFDVLLSTAFAILALNELGFRDRVLALSQLKLLDYLDDKVVSTPFYSTLKLDKDKFSPAQITAMIFADQGKQLIEIDDEYYSVSLYEDRAGIISNSVMSMALSVKSNPLNNDIGVLKENGDKVKEIYGCKSQREYIKLIMRNYV